MSLWWPDLQVLTALLVFRSDQDPSQTIVINIRPDHYPCLTWGNRNRPPLSFCVPLTNPDVSGGLFTCHIPQSTHTTAGVDSPVCGAVLITPRTSVSISSGQPDSQIQVLHSSGSTLPAPLLKLSSPNSSSHSCFSDHGSRLVAPVLRLPNSDGSRLPAPALRLPNSDR